MSYIELNAEELTADDNKINVEMEEDQIWFLKYFFKKYNPKKIVELGVSAGGNTINYLNWMDEDAELYSIDIAENWYRNPTKKTGFMVNESGKKLTNWKFYRGYDYIDVYEEIGNDIDLIIIDTVHALPGEILSFLAALPQLKDNCIVILDDIHLNSIKQFYQESVNDFAKSEFCTGLLFSSVKSKTKWTLNSDTVLNNIVSNISAFIIDKDTRENIKDIFHIIFTTWFYFPSEINIIKYLDFIKENYPLDCYKLFEKCLRVNAKYFDMDIFKSSEKARIDIINKDNHDNSIEILECGNICYVDYPKWFKKNIGQGVTLNSDKHSFDIKFKCINDGILDIKLMGEDIRNNNNKRIPRYVNYVSFKINKEEIFNNNIIAWHDNPYIYYKKVKDGEIIEIHCEWEKI